MKIKSVHEKGYVRLVDCLGSDLTPVNAARVSYNKESKELSKRDIGLINFLADHGHTSPFRHAVLQFEVYAPLMVARQWWKYIVGSSHQEGSQEAMNAWNESSRRYITESIEFYVPKSDEWRSAPDNSKQGSGEPVGEKLGEELTQRLLDQIEYGMKNYDYAIENNVATEISRLFIPSAYGLYVRWYWTASLQSVAHFLNQRLDSHSQYEIREFAKAVKELASQAFPIAIEKLCD